VPGARHDRACVRLLQRPAAELDLAALADLALDDRRLALHAAVQDDRHVVVDVTRRLALEEAAAASRERELHDRLVGELVAPRTRLLELFTRDDRLVLDGVQRAIRARAAGLDLGTPSKLEPARNQTLYLGPGEEALGHGHLLLGDEEFAGQRALV